MKSEAKELTSLRQLKVISERRQAAHADIHGLRYGALKVQGLTLERSHQSVISRTGFKKVLPPI